MAKRLILVVAVLAVVVVAVLWIARDQDDSDETRTRVERELSRAYRCPGQPSPRATCQPRDQGGFDCDVAGSAVRVENPDHLDFSQIC